MIHSTQCSERINAERIRYKVKRKLVDNEGRSPAICCSFVQLQPRVTCDRVVKHACQRSISRVGFIAPGYLSHRGAFYLFFFSPIVSVLLSTLYSSVLDRNNVRDRQYVSFLVRKMRRVAIEFSLSLRFTDKMYCFVWLVVETIRHFPHGRRGESTSLTFGTQRGNGVLGILRTYIYAGVIPSTSSAFSTRSTLAGMILYALFTMAGHPPRKSIPFLASTFILFFFPFFFPVTPRFIASRRLS